MQLVWLKRDLRLTDHGPLEAALANAEAEGSVALVYLHEPTLLTAPDFSAQHGGFIRECLDDLNQQLEPHRVQVCEQVGEAVESFERLWQLHPFSALWSYQETGTPATFARDRAVAAWCAHRGVTWTELEQDGVRRGRYYREQGFGFKAHLQRALAGNFFVLPAAAPLVAPWPRLDRALVPAGSGADKTARQRGGRQAAENLMAEFLMPEKLFAYPSSISSPNTALTGCSRLSPYLAFGVLSDREGYFALNEAATRLAPVLTESQQADLGRSVQFFAERLYWRSTYAQAFELHCTTASVSDLAVFEGVREAEFDPAWLAAWVAGNTGIPLIDAAMKMLAHTGWLNMRLRGTVTSFAVNELWLPWRDVGLHLAREFLDYWAPIHWNQLQIHSGCSRLSGPLTYNAVKQAQDQDPRGQFVKTWLPALRGVPVQYLAEPWKMPAAVQAQARCQIGLDYPAPLVPLAAAHDAARQRVAALREGRPPPNLLYWRTRAKERVLAHQVRLF